MKDFTSNLWPLVVLLLSLGSGSAAAADVTFGVNMQYRIAQGQFAVGTDQVVVVGSFSSTDLVLTDPDGDNIYTGTVTGQPEDTQLTYNYRHTHNTGTNTALVNETVAARPYVVQVTSAANVLTDWFNDQQPPYPYAKFFASAVRTIPGEVLRFNDASEGGAATSWNWTFQGGNPATSTAQNPTTVWSTPGTYAVTFTATNASGSTAAKTLNITVTTVDDVLGWWNDAVFYELYPRSFFDSNGNGTGDFPGLISKLDYLNDNNPATTTDLGVTALYLMPIHPANNAVFGGYEVTDYKGVINELGTQIDFNQFVAAAHARGIRVILDMVFNHSSNQHPWFADAATGTGTITEDYYVWRTNNPGSAWRNNPVAHTNPKVNVYWGKFGANTPDLNFNNASVRNTVKDISSYWINKNVDGFRLDAATLLYETGDAITTAQQENLPATYAYWRSWREHVKAARSTTFSVGETWLPNNVAAAAKYTYQGLDVGFQFDIAYGLEDALNYENASYLQSPVEQSMAYYPFLQFGVFASNHDLYRHNTTNYTPLRIKDRIDTNKDAKARLAAAWVLTAPGVPFLYYGDELGISSTYARSPMQWTTDNYAGFTTGIPWAGLGSSYATYNVATEQADANSILSAHKSLIAIRKAQPALRRGNYQTLTASSAGVYAFVRSYGAETVVVVLNLSSSAQSNVSLSASNTGLAAGTYGLTNLLNASQAAGSVTVSGGSINNWVPFASLPANGYAILKLNTTLATASPAAPASLVVYPNPVGQGRLTLELPGTAGTAQLRLFDGQGRLVRSRAAALSGGQATLEVSGLPAGFYLLQATAGGVTYTSKVSVN